ncbi:MAG TPA: gamma-glutamyltransferase [Bacteroidales bacterium]|nr:gamma-glutamyltransferase [Bacteroidales bacterium]
MKRTAICFLALFLISGCRETPSPVIMGRNITTGHGMVVSAHPEASETGVLILQKGGNAIDAAVATEFALSVCYPEAGNIGGGGFMLIRMSDGSSDVIDYREKASLGAYRDMFLDEKGDLKEGSSTETHLAAGVPGTVDGMIKVHGKYGRLSFREVIQPAIDLASKGFPVTEDQAGSFNRNKDYFLKMNAKPPAFVKDREWKKGDILRQPELAATLERIRDNGREGFYSGKTAEMIIREMKRGNGIISEQDLAEYKAVFRKPLSGEYRGYRIITIPPPSSGGIILLQLLKMLEPWPLQESGFHSIKAIHLIAEAEKRAFADRAEYAGDPDFIDVHTSVLLDQEYLKRRFNDFNIGMATEAKDVKAGMLPGFESDETTHYSVVDKDGNAVSATTTLNNLFGSSIVVEGAGFLLNDQMDDFSVKPGTPNMYGLVGGEANSISPGKRMLSSMTPTIVEKEGKLFLVAGSPGGSTIPTTVFQVITNVIDYKMDISQAVDTGRFHDQWLPDYIIFEEGSIDSLVLKGLKGMSYNLKEQSRIGSVNAIEILPDGKIKAGADRRGYNTACGY